MKTTPTRALAKLDYKNFSDKFRLREKNYSRQYAPLYAERLMTMREDVKRSALKKWPDSKITNLVDLETDVKCVIIGTLYKEMEQKPSILKELSDDGCTFIQPIKDRYTSENDYLILEDELQRIALIGDINIGRMCTGAIIALLGYENDNSKFVVEDYCFKELKHENSLEFPLKFPDRYIVFMSGLELGTNSNDLLNLQLFVDFLSGDFYDDTFEGLICNTERLIIVGNSLDSTTQSRDMHNKAKYLTKNYIAGSVETMKQLDNFIHQLLECIDVDIMPGQYDPSNYMMPQQPLHPAMFTRSSKYKTFHSATNPYEFQLDDICLIGTSGQPINDIKQYTDIDDTLEAMKLTIDCAHLAPTCPDTLACYPYYGQDPFILNRLPHVYFCGNQSEYKHEVYKTRWGSNQVHLLSIPRFRSTQSCVFLNLKTLESEEFKF